VCAFRFHQVFRNIAEGVVVGGGERGVLLVVLFVDFAAAPKSPGNPSCRAQGPFGTGRVGRVKCYVGQWGVGGVWGVGRGNSGPRSSGERPVPRGADSLLTVASEGPWDL